MPYQVGDLVLIVNAGYMGEGISKGDIGEVVRLSEAGSVYITGLPGTWAREEYPYGLLCYTSEVEPVETKQTGGEAMLEVGKYYLSKDGKTLLGPMKASDDDRYITCPATHYTYYKTDALKEFDLGEAVPVPEGDLEKGMLVQLKTGIIIRVLGVSRGRVTYSRGFFSDTDTFSYLGGSFVHFPQHKIEVTEVDLIGKWCKYGSGWVQITSCKLSHEQGMFPTSVQFDAKPVGTNYSFTLYQEIGEVLDEHPYEAGRIPNIQGEGDYLYAIHRETGKVWYAHKLDSREIILLNPEEGNVNTLLLCEESALWYSFHIFASPTAPEGYPFDAKNYREFVYSLYAESFRAPVSWLRDNVGFSVAFKAQMHLCRMATNTRGNVALYLNQSQLTSGKIQSLRPGRAFKFLMPNISDKELENLVDKFRKDFPVGDYVVKRGFDAKDFKHAYGHTSAPMQNPNTTYSRKSLGNSCMRHDFTHLPHHPAEAYASGEFEVLWTETPEGRIASRLVVWHPPEGNKLHGIPQAGPIYGVCEYSMDLLQDVLTSLGGKGYNDATWHGAKMQKIEHRGGVIGPYLDHDQSLLDDGDYLVIGKGNDYMADNYSGVLEGNDRMYCDECGDTIDPDYDNYYHVDRGCLCESCRDRFYFYCGEYEEDYPIEERCEVYIKARWGRESRYVCTEARNTYYVECTDGDWWHQDDVLTLANGDSLSPPDQDDAVMCEFTDEHYLSEDTLTTWDNQVMSKDYFNANRESYTLNEDGVVVEINIEEEAA